MILLKGYQARALDSLKDFMTLCAAGVAPAKAFETTQLKFGAPRQEYSPVTSPGLAPQMPSVCLRVPTGGGKTLLACHAVGIAIKTFLQAERGVVLWLVPSTTILDQTADALRDARHPYRRALEASCGAAEVLTIEEALRLSRATLDGATVVIVATMQAFKAEDPTQRRVYAQNSHFSEHLLNLPTEGMLLGPGGMPVPSLVNALRLRRPIVVIDEAHNAGTDLSFSALADVRPSCVLEFTATPARAGQPSNVLHQVSAAELKAADMAKLPMRVVSRHAGQREELLAEAVSLRRSLEKLALVEGQNTGEYLRPILLIQAENVAACEGLKRKLVAELGFGEPEVKISVGGNDELADIGDLSSPKCPVRAVITVQRLREGWDCPFAYVLCSLRETRSPTAIEQIVGRIMRLPGAKAKASPELNCAYVFSVSPSIGNVLEELRAALVGNGFTPAEAGRILRPEVQVGLPLISSALSVVVGEGEIDVAASARGLEALGGKATMDSQTGNIVILAPLDEAQVDLLAGCVRSPEAKASVRELASAVKALDALNGGRGADRPVSPWERGLDFSVPLLCVKESTGLFELESTFLLEHPWNLSDKDASLADYDPNARPKGRVGALDVGATGQITTESLVEEGAADFLWTLQRDMVSLGIEEEWTEAKLVAWLDWRIGHQDIQAGEAAAFILKAVRGVTTSRGVGIDVVAADRFRMREAVEKRINEHRDSERQKAFRGYLLGNAALAVDSDRALDFRTISYEPSWLYNGTHKFKKHYYGERPGELEWETAGGRLKEEFQCALFLDDHTQVEYWVRNLARKPGSFRLLTPEGWFYPDFVVRLKDGRILAVEYKGAYLMEGAKDKLAVGAAWAERSAGRCVFVMPTDGDFSVIARVMENQAL